MHGATDETYQSDRGVLYFNGRQKLSAYCNAQGNPQPKCKWMLAGTSHELLSETCNASLMVNVSGSLTCVASNIHGSSRSASTTVELVTNTSKKKDVFYFAKYFCESETVLAKVILMQGGL